MYHTLPLPVGKASADANLAADLGKLYIVNGNAYRLVKAGAAIATAASLTLATALSSGVPTWAVDVSTTANAHTVVGVVPAGQTGSTGTTGLVSGDYFLLQCSGPTKCISAAAIADGAAVGCSTTAGKIDDASVTLLGDIGVALEAAGAGDATIDVMLRGLI